MPKTLTNFIDYVNNIQQQIEADAKTFATTAAAKRREAHINGRIKELESNYSDAKAMHIKIISAKEENNLKEKYFLAETFIKLKEAYLAYHGELYEALNAGTQQTKNTAATQDKNIDIKLRRIEIPPFSGGYDQWRPFYELYVSLVHKNESLADIQKLHYLKTSVQGEAARLLQHISLEEKNYVSAWTILTDRYENKRVLVNTHLRILLTQKTLITETAAGIKGILDTTTECLHSLRNLGLPVDTWDMILIYLLSAKLPTYTQELWEGQLLGASSLVEFTSFTKFLETRFRTLESIEQSKLELRKNTKAISPVTYRTPFKQTQTFHTGIAKTQRINTSPNSTNCRLCKNDHNLHQCEQFRKLEVKERLELVRKFAACINCLSFKHTKKQCTSRYRCRECHQAHHTLLHLSSTQLGQSNQRQNKGVLHTNNKPTKPNIQQYQANIQPAQFNTQCYQNSVIPQCQHQTPSQENQATNFNQTVQTLFTQHGNPTKILLATALVNCQASNGEYITLRALIDPGSEATFITESAAQRLRLQKRKTAINVISLGQLTTGTARSQTTITISSTHNPHFILTIEAYIYANITSILPSETFEFKHWEHLEGLTLADPTFNVPGKIDLLLGADVYSTIVLPGLKKGLFGAPIAQYSELGWIISGHVSGSTNKTIHTHHQLINLDAQLRRFWEIEEISENRKLTEEETLCEEHYAKTHSRQQDGRYQVHLPFKDNVRPSFRDSKQSAISRLFHLEKRFQVNPKLKEMYTECLKDYISSSHMTEIQATNKDDSYYLPHHAVFKDSSTTKLRVVFDASCKSRSGQSLNDRLMIGPTIQNDLSSIIIKWRKFKVAYTADITKMYRQIWVDPRDTTYQLICWRDNVNDDIKTYALKTVTFGTASAPFLAVRTLRQLADDEQQNFPIASVILKNNFYVDDVMHGADSISEAIESQRQLINATNSAGFPLRKWASNEEAVLEQVPKDHREINIPLNFGNEDYVKALGFQWYPGPDIFKLNFKLPKLSKISKRTILSDISRLFDPHGWISPCIVYAKLILQELWLLQADWDEPVPEHLQTQWLRYRSELHILESVEIPRWIKTTSTSKNIQIHGFCDASERAYAAVIYIRIETKETVHIQLLTAKTKIAPLKRISLPRLELCAAVLLAKLLESTKRAMEFQKIKTFAWTDSMIALSWIQANPSKWKSFVANRVTEIQARTDTNMWHHVNTKNNPADIASRGLYPSEIEHIPMWWEGPPMLKTFTGKIRSNAACIDTDLEMRKVKTFVIGTSKSVIQEIIENFSTLNKTIRVISYCLRAIHNFKYKWNEK